VSRKNIKKLNKLISKIISLLERDISEITPEELKKRKNISSILSRLVTSTIQLNRLKDEDEISLDILTKKDLQILEDFLDKYRK
jgi:hypothetical protein